MQYYSVTEWLFESVLLLDCLSDYCFLFLAQALVEIQHWQRRASVKLGRFNIREEAAEQWSGTPDADMAEMRHGQT